MENPKNDVETDLLVMATASLQKEVDNELSKEDPEESAEASLWEKNKKE